MRTLSSRIGTVFCAVLVLIAAEAAPAGAQKLRTRDDRGSNSRDTVERSDNGDVRIKISTEDGDSVTSVTIHRRDRWRNDDTNSIVRMGEDIVIEAGQVIPGDVVAIGGNVKVLGRVKGNAIAIGGSLDLEGDGVVEGDAVSLGGGVHRAAGTKIGGENVGMRFIPVIPIQWVRPHGGLGHGLLALPIIILLSIFLFLVGWIFTVAAENRMLNMGRYVEQHLWQCLLTGIAVLILFPIAFLLLLVTVVGIPLALLSPLALGLAHLVGFLVVATLVGQRMISSAGTDRGAQLKGMLIGLLLFAGISVVGHLLRAVGGPVGFLGLIVVVFGYGAGYIAATIGLGSVILSRFGQESRLLHGAGPTAAPQPSMG